MLKELRFNDKKFFADLDALLDRSAQRDSKIEKTVTDIIADVKTMGDEAVIKYSKQFDDFVLGDRISLELDINAIEEYSKRIEPELDSALKYAADRIRNFHEKEILESWSYTEADGTHLGQRITPVDKVGVYVPGGKAAYPSSVLMTTIPAKVAGVEEITMTVPTPGGEIHPGVIAAASIAGVDRIFTIGGAQAIAALAYGTESIPKVDKIVGPGNIYVATAKKMVFGDVGIDMVAGPSEVVVICDDSADPDWVAMDLFAQAEHDELAQSIVITSSIKLIEKIKRAVEELLPPMERKAIIEKSLTNQGGLILVDTIDQAASVSNHIAPEHLELMVNNENNLLDKITHAGAIFVGKYSAEVLGDYCAGPNHVLPTSGTARFSSPLGVYDFQKRSSLIRVSSEGAKEMAKVAAVLARSEGLTAHAKSATYRISTETKS